MARILDAIEAGLGWLLIGPAMVSTTAIVGAALVWSLVTSVLIAAAPWWPVFAGLALIFTLGR